MFTGNGMTASASIAMPPARDLLAHEPRRAALKAAERAVDGLALPRYSQTPSRRLYPLSAPVKAAQAADTRKPPPSRAGASLRLEGLP